MYPWQRKILMLGRRLSMLVTQVEKTIDVDIENTIEVSD